MAEIKKVVIEAGGKEFSLSVREAKALRDILNATFKDATPPDYLKELKAMQEENKRLKNAPTPYVPYYPPPIIIDRHPQPWGRWITWCSADSSTLHISANSSNSITL